jgi:hypothetical protein
MIADYSSNPTLFMVTAQPGEHLSVARLLWSLRDGTIQNADVYGGLGAALTNGIEVYVTDDNGDILYYLTPAEPIKTNAGWNAVCYDVDYHYGFASGDDFIHARWTFTKFGQPLILNPGWSLCVLAQDNFTGTSRQVFVLEGFVITPTLRGSSDVGHA